MILYRNHVLLSLQHGLSVEQGELVSGSMEKGSQCIVVEGWKRNCCNRCDQTGSGSGRWNFSYDYEDRLRKGSELPAGDASDYWKGAIPSPITSMVPPPPRTNWMQRWKPALPGMISNLKSKLQGFSGLWIRSYKEFVDIDRRRREKMLQ